MKQFFLFISILFAFNLSAQSTWNDVNEKVSTTPTPSYDSTFVLEAQSRAGIATGQANWVPASSGGASYLVYTALLTQTGTSAPVATVLENTLGGTVVWTYNDVGDYTATLSGAFTANKTFGGRSYYYDENDGLTIATWFRSNSNAVSLEIRDTGLSYKEMGLLGSSDRFKLFFEIRVYP